MTNSFIAYAQTAGGQGAAAWTSFVPIVLMIVIFYFLLIRPQQKKEKDRKKMIESIQKGDKVLTIGGIFGIVSSINETDGNVVLKISDNAKVEITRAAIQQKIS